MDNPARAAILQRMIRDTDIAIVGGGLNGCALALACARLGLRVALIDALPVATRALPAFDGRSYALALGSQRMLAALDLWQALDPNAEPIRRVQVSDGRIGMGTTFLGLDFDAAEIADGPTGYMIEDRHLRLALLDALAATPGIDHRAGETVVAQSTGPDGASLTLASGTTLTAQLIVGADGKGSGTARRAGITRTGWQYRQSALVCAIAHEARHEGTAHQLFLPSGPLAILPLTGNQSAIVWTEETALAAQINALSDADYLAVLRPRFGDFLGQITLAGARYSYPLGLSLANHIVADRLALVGDAAHAVHPIAGQGLNAGLRDVAALVHVLDHAQRRGEDIASPLVLDRYAQWRRFDTATLAAATDIFNRLFSSDNPLLRATRDLGMALVNAAPALRRGAMREAAGLSGDLPDLMRD
ncbi:UbiH/UbiF/VisC/COQ6 family ubiquinone biosynthesis hydroxylase [Puniceibacterium sp. IMCC21224]|uniref:UbiH/UbiF/VisC/COQ6 family ubiquinone biosynthesis hydroxylase n=1 Tax=Puniceibacterium sp. IMCC21224 TaxID=1618204 RepID=UPI00065CC870|nr:UbiH/UbiF/VisC/COQ6 family ubiquinone biosynthesis hydroxylase [Puniceibacterium sp. IMCC21224]KMK65568.1 Ubiquinone biosynthesis hydroxylase, UbiH/UbiF/VisC/COQ6 family [Puniceibacterium sp. IMCC21224]